ncbi:hypothetical protein ACHAPK_011874, partial [Fusarium culmorum]
MVPTSFLNGIPDLAKWLEDHPFDFIGEDEDVNASPNAEDFISVASSLELPQLPRALTSGIADVGVIVCSQTRASQKASTNHTMAPFGVEINREETEEIPEENWSGWGYDRRPNNYSSREGSGVE